MRYEYLIMPFIAWLAAGTLKFIVNSYKARQLAFNMIGYGGLPSNHSAIVSGMVTLIGINEGIDHPAFGVAITLAFIVMLDANSLRNQIGKHAVIINKLNYSSSEKLLRERVGHSKLEILLGVLVGAISAYVLKMSLI